MTAGKGVIAIATSIPPRQVREDAGRAVPDYQALCIQSWLDNGFRILSVNHPDEISGLAARHPEVAFVPASRDASEWTGRKNPYIADLLLALEDAKEPVLGLINSDLLFEPSPAWAENLPRTVPHTMVMAHRYNTNSLHHGALRRFQGFDCFFFDHALARHALRTAMPFAIGAPWWDYWLPCIALLNNRDVAVVDRPAILHLLHKTAYSRDQQVKFGRELARTLIGESENTRSPEPPVFAAVKQSLLEIADPSLDNDVLKRKFAEFCDVFASQIRQTAVTWQAGGGDSASAISAFERFDQRLCAGDAFQQAKTLLGEKRLADAGPDVVAALKQAQGDPEVLWMLGEISCRQGDVVAAESFLSRAAELLPDAPAILHSQAVLLHAKGKREEALGRLRRALEIEPAYQPSCIAIAKILLHRDGLVEAVCFLDEVLARHPGLQQVTALRDDYRSRNTDT